MHSYIYGDAVQVAYIPIYVLVIATHQRTNEDAVQSYSASMRIYVLTQWY